MHSLDILVVGSMDFLLSCLWQSTHVAIDGMSRFWPNICFFAALITRMHVFVRNSNGFGWGAVRHLMTKMSLYHVSKCIKTSECMSFCHHILEIVLNFKFYDKSLQMVRSNIIILCYFLCFLGVLCVCVCVCFDTLGHTRLISLAHYVIWSENSPI